jgi:hypothetical protein
LSIPPARAQNAGSPALLNSAGADTPPQSVDQCLPDPDCTPYPSCMFDIPAACREQIGSPPSPGRPGNIDFMVRPMPGVTGGMNAQSIQPGGALGGIDLQNSLQGLQLPQQGVP